VLDLYVFLYAGMMTFPMQTLPDLMAILSSEFQSLDLFEEDFIHPNVCMKFGFKFVYFTPILPVSLVLLLVISLF